MNKTASMVLKIIGASLAFAAVICLLIGGWHDLTVGCCGMKKRLRQRGIQRYEEAAGPEIRLRVRRLRRRRALRVIQSIKRTPSRWMGPFSAFFPPQGNKKRLEEIPNRNEIPLDRGKKPW